MGKLVLFRLAEDRERKSRASGDETAQILFFTGVRYQRFAETDVGASAPAADRCAPPSDGLGGDGGGRKRRG